VRLVWILTLLLSPAISASADVVLMKNGDRITGSWERVEDGRLFLKSEVLGAVSVPVTKIQLFSFPGTTIVILRSGDRHHGVLALTESGDYALTGDADTRVIPAASMAAAYPQPVTSSGQFRGVRRVLADWKGTSNVGYSLVQGDRQVGTLSVGFNSARKPPMPSVTSQWRSEVNASLVIASSRRAPAPRVSARSMVARVRQDYLLTKTDFIFGLAQFEHLEAQGLDLRQTYGAGLGRDIIRRQSTSFGVIAGMTLVREQQIAGVDRQNAEALAGAKLTFDVWSRNTVHHAFNFYPNFTGRYRLDTTTALTTRIWPRVTMNITLVDRYVSRAQPERTKNELVLTTGFGVRF